MVVKYFFFFALLTFYACSSGENGLLELALDKSGENRSELEVVLDHYKDDLKKLEAARFLICNMIGKQVLDSNSVKGNQVYFDAFANYRETYGSFLYDIQYAIYDSINKSYSHIKVNPRFLFDLKELSSDYLIQVDFWVDDWVWDTYLALHPLQVLLNPEAQEQKLASYIRMYEQSGWIPTFPCVFGDAHCMNGNHAAGVFADALNKGLRFDVEKAFEGMKHTVMTESMIPWYRGPKTALDDFYHENGWFPALHPGEKEEFTEVGPFEQRQAAAVTTAASYDDWCIAQLAKHLGKDEDYRFFQDRSYNYRNVFNKETHFFHPKDKDGKFIEPFDYIFSGGIGARAYFDENNAWTYNWDVRHHIQDLIDLFGGNTPFIERLDQLFVEDMKMSKWQYYALHPDATGNVGQFVMGNEPSFHIPYLYNYAGQPWKTQKRIRMLMESWFRNDLMGVCGDEDGGGMSAFYVFSALGFYPVSPGVPVYTIGSPLFDKSEIQLADGKVFTMIAHGVSWENKYIQSAKLNGAEYNKTWFTHEDVMKGGTLELFMGDRPNKKWGVGEGANPPSGEFVD